MTRSFVRTHSVPNRSMGFGCLTEGIDPHVAHIESFNGRPRQASLSQRWFLGLADAEKIIAAWREEYNNHRPHNALKSQAPAQCR